MKFDPSLPPTLKAIQTWFGAVISQKMTDDFEINPIAPSGLSIQEEAKEYIAETKELPAAFRMQLYNQSYWLRLLDALHAEFPLVVRLFGKDAFNQSLGIPYLDCAPPRHWLLTNVADRFVSWIRKNYHEKDAGLVLLAAQLDAAFSEIFIVKRKLSTDMQKYSGKNRELLLQLPITLQSTVRLFSYPGNLLEFRKEMVAQSIEYWEEHDFPELKKDKTYYFILYRASSLSICWDELSQEEFVFLQLIEKHRSINAACEAVEKVKNINHLFLEENISVWIQKWFKDGIIFLTHIRANDET